MRAPAPARPSPHASCPSAPTPWPIRCTATRRVPRTGADRRHRHGFRHRRIVASHPQRLRPDSGGPVLRAGCLHRYGRRDRRVLSRRMRRGRATGAAWAALMFGCAPFFAAYAQGLAVAPVRLDVARGARAEELTVTSHGDEPADV